MPQLNVRVGADLRNRLRLAAEQRGVSQSDLVRGALEYALVGEHAASRFLWGGAPSSQEPPLSSPPGFQFDGWLAFRTGFSRALVARMITRGRVCVNGDVCRDLVLERPSVAVSEVTIDGRAVSRGVSD